MDKSNHKVTQVWSTTLGVADFPEWVEAFLRERWHDANLSFKRIGKCITITVVTIWSRDEQKREDLLR